jgi:hypothetical protein
MGWLGTLSANTTLALRTGRAGAAAATADLELATVFDVFEVADPEALGAVADELETVTVFPEFALATEFLLLELSALFDSEDFVLLERTVTVFADDLVPSSALVVESVELFALGLLGECAAPDPASGCFESNAVGEDATAFDSTGVEIVDVLEPALSGDSPRGLAATAKSGFRASPLAVFATGFAFRAEALFAGFLARAAATTDCRSGCPGCVSPSLELFCSVGDFGIALAST